MKTPIEWLVENYLPLKRGQELEHEHTVKVIKEAITSEKSTIIGAFISGYMEKYNHISYGIQYLGHVSDAEELAEQYYRNLNKNKMVPLKEAIAENHLIAEKTLFSQRMLSGDLSNKDYHMYLVQELAIFAKIEKRYILPHKSLSRLYNINLDILELGRQLLFEGSSNDMVYLKSTMDYTGYLGTLWGDELMPHMYVNYLKLLYGGQIIKKKVPGSGLLYDFNFANDAIASIRNLQKDEWAEEANKGLIYNINILNELQRVSESNV